MHNVILNDYDLSQLIASYSRVEAFAFDVETWGEHRGDPWRNSVLWISLATEGRTDVIPLGHPNGEFIGWDKPLLASGRAKVLKGIEPTEKDYSTAKANWRPLFGPPPKQLSPAAVFWALEPLFFGPALKIAQNAKFDLGSIAKYYRGRIAPGPYFDTMLAAYTVDSRNRDLGVTLDKLAKRYLQIDLVKGIGKKVEDHPFDEVAEYSGRDSEVTWLVWKALQEAFDQQPASQRRVLALEMDVLPVVVDMELAGAPMDEDALRVLKDQLEGDLEAAKAKVFAAAGRPFNLRSNPEKQRLLFGSKEAGGLGLKPKMKDPKSALTPAGLKIYRAKGDVLMRHLATSEKALAPHKNHPLVAALLEHAELSKLYGTYIVPYGGGDVERTTGGKTKIVTKVALVNKGRIHPEFNQCGADTGRMSCKEPNLQNVPATGPYGKLIRSLFRAPAGWKLVQADWSQIEPRIIASLSGDPVMIRNYLDGGDIYCTIGDHMGVSRKAGKTLVLAIAYGVGPETIAENINCTVREAQDLMAGFAKKFPLIPRHKAKVIRIARGRTPIPFSETIFGRRRMLPDLKSQWPKYRQTAERQAYNALIQGSAADMMKIALVRAHECFVDEPDVRLILTVHDEMLALAPDHLAEETAECIRAAMEDIHIPDIKVPLVAKTNIVQDWSSCK